MLNPLWLLFSIVVWLKKKKKKKKKKQPLAETLFYSFSDFKLQL